jgi:rhodanese-related sulfurtransferase
MAGFEAFTFFGTLLREMNHSTHSNIIPAGTSRGIASPYLACIPAPHHYHLTATTMSAVRLLPRLLRPQPLAALPRPSLPRVAIVLPRSYSSSTPPAPKQYTYPSILSLAQTPTPTTTLIDVREPSEYSAGFIPGAINLPIASSPDALSLPPDEFEDRFGFEKPAKDQEVVFYCKAGVRSHAAARLAQQEGYEKVGEYPGSWMDWVKNRGG